MNRPCLSDPNCYPDSDVLRQTLGVSYSAFEQLIGTITSKEFGLILEWNYYKDGKSWLGKVSYKKKTVFWLSVWENCFKAGFYFSEKTKKGVLELDITAEIKDAFTTREPVGKLFPLVLELDSGSNLSDALTLVRFKMQN